MALEPAAEGDAYVAARAAILLLRAIVPSAGAVAPGVVRLGPGSSLLPDEVAAQALASVPKPVECRGDIEEGALTFKHHELSGEGLRFHRSTLANAEIYGGLLDEIDEETGLPTVRLADLDLVRLLGRGEETMLVSGVDFLRLQREYVFKHSHFAAADRADSADQALGIRWVARYATSHSRSFGSGRSRAGG